jgi:hypothetical protein
VPRLPSVRIGGGAGASVSDAPVQPPAELLERPAPEPVPHFFVAADERERLAGHRGCIRPRCGRAWDDPVHITPAGAGWP